MVYLQLNDQTLLSIIEFELLWYRDVFERENEHRRKKKAKLFITIKQARLFFIAFVFHGLHEEIEIFCVFSCVSI